MSDIKPKLSVTVIRSKWVTGKLVGDPFNPNATGDGPTQLLNSEGYRCCLGFIAQAGGVPDIGLLEIGTPIGCSWEFKDQLRSIGLIVEGDCTFDSRYRHSEFTKSAIAINDDTGTTQAEKEVKLLALAALENIELNFVD